MDTITVNAGELCKLAEQIKRDKMDYVTLYIMEAEEFDGDAIPVTMNVSAHKAGTSGEVDYGDIEHVDAG